MKERIGDTKEGRLEIRTLGVGDNLIIVDTDDEALELDKDTTTVTNTDNLVTSAIG